jgi:hypothetical protein
MQNHSPIIFPTDYNEVLERINTIHPIKYAQSRNFLNGHVTYLSPYISRGVISVKQVMDSIVSKGYPGIKDDRDWMFPTVTGYYPSFFSYWKKCERALKHLR